VRATTSFNRMLAIPGAAVADISFTPQGVVVGLRRRFRRLTCPCGFKTGAAYDSSVRRWRHLDLGACRLLLECEIRRLHCRRCERVVTEQVPWARPGARHTRDFEDVVAYLAQRVDRTTVARLLRCSWEAVANIVGRVVASAIDDSRLDDLYRIGVDEIAYRKGHRYLTIVADHDRDDAVVWAAEGKKAETLEAFYDELGEHRIAKLKAVSLDMGGAYAKATAERASHVRQCVDPFHVVKLCNEAIDKCRRWAWNLHRASGDRDATWVKRTRWALVKDPKSLKRSQRDILDELRRSRSVLYRAWLLKEELRDVYRYSPRRARRRLERWLSWACRSRIPAFVKLSQTIRKHQEGILAAIELALSNSKLEGISSKIRLINHRGYGHHSAAALISMIHLCCGGITVQLPTER
jgi:transposase